MTAKLLNSLKEYITPDLISKASNLLGESEKGITKAIATALPTVLSGMLNKLENVSVMATVMDLVSKNNSNFDGILSNLTSFLNPDPTVTPNTKQATNLLETLFGKKQLAVGNLVADIAGTKTASASAILGMVGQMVVGHLAKTGTTLAGLTNLLNSEKDNILSVTPVGLATIAGFQTGFGATIKQSADMSISSNKSVGTSSGFPKWLLPLLLIAGILVALYYFSKSCSKNMPKTDTVIQKLDTVTSRAIDSAKSNIKKATNAIDVAKSNIKQATNVALGNFFTFKLPNGITLNAPEKGVENKIVTWLQDKTKVVDKTTWFNFDRLLFETGKSKLKPESQEQLKNIAEIMKAFPAMEIKLGGYTDNVGNSSLNLKLSGDRAKSVKTELVAMGIATNRIATEGYGDKFPVATNDTEQGRAENRRIAIRITKK